MPEAHADSVFALFQKLFHVERGSARGVSVRIRRKLRPHELGRAKSLPPIEGFSDPPRKGPDKPDPSDEDYPYFTFDVERVTAELVREVWVDSVRVVDRGLVRGGFYLRPLRRVELRPSTAALLDAAVLEGATPVASGLRGKVELRVLPFDPRNADMRSSFSGRARAEGQLDGLEVLERWIPMKIEGGAGDLQIDAEVTRGVVHEGSRASAWLSRASFQRWPHELALRPWLAARSEQDAIAISLEARKLTLYRAGTPLAVAESAAVLARVRDESLRASLSVDLPEIEIPRLERLGTPIFQGGSAFVTGHADLDGVARGRADVTFDQANVRVNERAMTLDGRAHLEVPRCDLGTKRGAIDGSTLDLRDPRTGSWIAADARGEVSDTSADVAFQGRARDPELLYHALDVPDLVRELLGRSALRFEGSAQMAPSLFSLRGVQLKGDSLEVKGKYLSRGEQTEGAALVRKGPVSAGILVRGSSVKVLPLVGDDWFRDSAPRSSR